MKLFAHFSALLLVCVYSTHGYALSITQVSVSSKWITESDSEKMLVTFTLSEPASVNLNIYDARDYLIRRISGEEILKSGSHKLEWDIRDSSNKIVPSGAYHFTLDATTTPLESSSAENPKSKIQKGTNRTVYDLTDITGNKRRSARQVEVNKDDNKINYVLPSASLVSVRIGLKDGGPLMKTLVDWLPRPAGKNSEIWDGMDESGHIKLAEHPQKDIVVLAYEFPENSVLIGRDIDRRDFVTIRENSLTQRESRAGTKNRFLNMVPTRQAPKKLGDVQLKLELADTFRKNKEGAPMVDGRVAFRLNVADKDKEKTASLRYEAAFFVDGLKVYENEIGFLPMTWYWDTKGINPGSHFITANLIGYEGSFGIQTMKVEVQ